MNQEASEQPGMPNDSGMPALRVAIILDTIPVGGPGKGVVQFARSLRSYDRPVELSVYNFTYAKRGRQLFNELASANDIDLRKIEQSRRLDWRFLDDLAGDLYRERIDLIQTHSFKPHVVGWRLSRSVGVPWVAFAHGWTAQSLRVHLYNVLERRLFRKADFCCTVTENLRDELISHGCDRDRVRVIPNAVEIPEKAPEIDLEKIRQEFGLRPDTVVMSCISRFSKEKGQDILLEAIASGYLDDLDYQLAFAGSGPEEVACRQFVDDNDLWENVVFVGHLTDIDRLYSVTDMLVVPSRSEGVPNVVLESFSRDIPVVSTPVGAVPTMIRDSRAGWLAEDVSPSGLGRALQEATRDISQLKDVGKKGSAYVDEFHSPADRRDQILRIYDRLTRNNEL